MFKVQFQMQVTGSQVNFASDIPNFCFVSGSVAKSSSGRFLKKLAFQRFAFIKTDETYRDNQVKTYVYGYIFAFSLKPDHAFVAKAFLR